MRDDVKSLREEYKKLKQEYHERRPKMNRQEREELSADLDRVRRQLEAAEEADRG